MVLMFFFLRRYGGIIKYDIIQTVQDFFKNGKIFRFINCVYIILVFKIYNVICMKDFRSVICCTVLYKIILKF